MNTKTLIQGLALTTLLASVHIASAVTYELCTGVTTKTMPDGNVVTMWGYGGGLTADVTPNCNSATVPGPRLDVPVGDITGLTINLRNTLSEGTSIMIPGLSVSTYLPPTFLPADSQGRIRARAMTQEAAAGGGTQSYSFNAAPGSYLYQSGSHPAVQVQMGLYGGVFQDAAVGQAYTGVPYSHEVVLLYSEIDPGLHNAVATGSYGTSPYVTTINYVPKYFLVNGAPFAEGSTSDILGGIAGETTLIRFLNAGLETHVPVLHGGDLDLIAEYGSRYPFPRKQYSIELVAGQSRDALFTPDSAGRYAIYDRRLRLTNNTSPKGGLMSFLAVTADPGAPIAISDTATVNEDSVSTIIDLASNDGAGLNLNSIHIPFQPENGLVVINNDNSGTVSYTPSTNFNGTDTFTYTIKDTQGKISNSASATATVSPINDIPTATDDTYTMDASVTPTLNVVATGVLNNDSDIDLDPLTAVLQTNVTGGTLAFNSDGSFAYTPNNTTTIDTFTYVANDGFLNSAPVTVTINIASLPAATLIAPTGAISALTPPTYSWNKAQGSTQYKLFVSNAATGSQLINQLFTASEATCDVTPATICEITPNVPVPTGNYRWWIRTLNASGWGPWSSPMSFSVGSAPAAATLNTPTGNIATNTPAYNWNAVLGSTQYKLYVSNAATGVQLVNQLFTAADAQCDNPTIPTTCELSSTTVTLPTLPDGNYRWWIRTLNSVGWGPWSSPVSFSVGSAPAAATLNTPTGNIVTNTPAYNWNAVLGATQYKLYVSNAATGVQLVNQLFTAADAQCDNPTIPTTCELSSTTVTLPTLPDGNYRWWVRTLNPIGWGPWSSPTSFNVTTIP